MTATQTPRIHGRDAIVEEVTYPQSIDTVWRALTDAALLERWLMASSDFEPRLGQRFSFHTKPAPGFSGLIECVVDELDPPTVLGYSWWGGGGNPRTHVRFELATVSDGTRLRLEHTGFAAGGIRGELVRRIMGSGWHGKILEQALRALLRELESHADA